jgi:hypothetical protein
MCSCQGKGIAGDLRLIASQQYRMAVTRRWTRHVQPSCYTWSNFYHDCVAAFKLLEKSLVPPPLSAKHLPGGQTKVLNVCWIKWIDRHPHDSDRDNSPESVSDPENWLNWNVDLNTATDSEDDSEADNASELEVDNGSENSETPELRNVSAAPNVPWLIRPIWRSKKKVQKALLMVNIMETRRNKEIKTT